MLWENLSLTPSFTPPPPHACSRTLKTLCPRPNTSDLLPASPWGCSKRWLWSPTAQCPPLRVAGSGSAQQGGEGVILQTCHECEAKELCGQREGKYPDPLISEPSHLPQPCGASWAPTSQTNAPFDPPASRRRTKDKQHRG